MCIVEYNTFVVSFCVHHRVAVQQAIRAASAFNCHINKTSYFERKHYFYQDLPLGYQVRKMKIILLKNDISDHASIEFCHEIFSIKIS